MSTRSVVIGSKVGLHARPASRFVQAVQGSGAAVTIAKGDGPGVNAGSILAVMGLGARHGDTVRISADGVDTVLDELAILLSGDGEG
jgi:phosphocarrier protein